MYFLLFQEMCLIVTGMEFIIIRKFFFSFKSFINLGTFKIELMAESWHEMCLLYTVDSRYRLSLSRNQRDPLKHIEISVLRHIRFSELRKIQIAQPNFTNQNVIDSFS